LKNRISAGKDDTAARVQFLIGDEISTHHLPRLTEQFYRVDAHIARCLWCRTLAGDHQTYCKSTSRLPAFESAEGKGTNVSNFLPITQDHQVKSVSG